MIGDFGETAEGTTSGTTWRSFTLVMMAVLGVLVVVALGLTLKEADRQRDRALALQKHSYDVMILSANLAGTLARAEASLGRYVISLDDRLGQAYSADWQLASQQISRLKRITHDNPSQQGAIEALRRAFRTRSTELDGIALNTFYKRNTQALGLYYKVRQSPSRDAIDRLLTTIGDEERTVLEQRGGAALKSVARSSRIASALGVFGVLILLGALAMGWLTVTALAQRAAARAEAESERDRAIELEAAVAKASSELLEQEAKLRQVQKLEAVGQLTGGIAHDFNNMLTGIIGGLDMIRRNLPETRSEKVDRYLSAASVSAQRAAGLTQRLLAFSRRQSLDVVAVDVGALVEGIEDLLRRTLGENIALDVRRAPDLWRAKTDANQLESALLNLTINARDAMPDGGRLTIETANVHLDAGYTETVDELEPGDYLVVAVSDTGTGMTESVIAKAFDPFFTTKPIGQGTGLGLSMIYGFAHQSGGHVRIESAEGRGTTITLYLPRFRGGADASAAVERYEPLPRARGESVLVVEDDSAVRMLIADVLEGLGYRVIEAWDGPAALPILASDMRIDLLVSDVGLPGMSGREVAEIARHYRPQLKVLFVTGYAAQAAVRGEFLGDDMEMITKPFPIDLLAARISALIGGG